MKGLDLPINCWRRNTSTVNMDLCCLEKIHVSSIPFFINSSLKLHYLTFITNKYFYIFVKTVVLCLDCVFNLWKNRAPLPFSCGYTSCVWKHTCVSVHSQSEASNQSHEEGLRAVNHACVCAVHCVNGREVKLTITEKLLGDHANWLHIHTNY